MARNIAACDSLRMARCSCFAIRSSHIVCEARVPGIDAAAFANHAEATKFTCPVSKALAGIEISLDARLAR